MQKYLSGSIVSHLNPLNKKIVDISAKTSTSTISHVKFPYYITVVSVAFILPYFSIFVNTIFQNTIQKNIFYTFIDYLLYATILLTQKI